MIIEFKKKYKDINNLTQLVWLILHLICKISNHEKPAIYCNCDGFIVL